MNSLWRLEEQTNKQTACCRRAVVRLLSRRRRIRHRSVVEQWLTMVFIAVSMSRIIRDCGGKGGYDKSPPRSERMFILVWIDWCSYRFVRHLHSVSYMFILRLVMCAQLLRNFRGRGGFLKRVLYRFPFLPGVCACLCV